ncbi:hypothetical protein NQ317_007371 [Molorchus minor]|uniref:Nidogen n=1 Tax=Molorchus minor TaxID=1323400 RepID=A0ABQ9IYF9_9CUCU|nr:hypothetical protein NQ317_007371 [Molorchus minor]
MRQVFWCLLWCFLYAGIRGIPFSLLYDHNVPESQFLPKQDDVSSPEIKLRVPVVFFGTTFESIYVNSNGFLSFQTEIPHFINREFPLDYPIIAPFYSNVDTRNAGSISFYETDNSVLLERATENVHEAFINAANFQATNLFIVTWNGVGYFKRSSDKLNTYQVVLITDGVDTYVEFLYPENGLQWIQGTGDETGLPDARAQAGIISPDGRLFTLPGSGTEKVRNLERWSNIGLEGRFIYKVDGVEVQEPDTNFGKKPSFAPLSCSEAPTFCHVQARCIDYEEGLCCECDPRYYGNGKFCVKNGIKSSSSDKYSILKIIQFLDVPLRVNGKINGRVNGVTFEGLDLQSYIVMSDGRAYTAISRIPEEIGFDSQSLQVIGGVIGYLFAKPIREAINGYQLTGGVFNHTATITFLNTSQIVRIKQKFLGLDVFDQLRLTADIQGNIPKLPIDSQIIVDEYEEQYTVTSPGILQMTSHRTFDYSDIDGEKITLHYKVDQTFIFDYCKFRNSTVGVTWKLNVGKNFISYESREQIIRYGLGNKIAPLGGEHLTTTHVRRADPNAAKTVGVSSKTTPFRCVCNPGFHQYHTGGETLCTDTNECQIGQHECDYNAQCINVIGSYTCQCNPGFEGDGFSCGAARSCRNVTCGENADCREENETATCRCIPGFTGDGETCTPVADSCYETNNCSPFGYCSIDPKTNIYFCACLPEYTGDGYNCVLLETTTQEVTTIGSRIPPKCLLDACWCPEGYNLTKDSTYCIPDDGLTYPTITTIQPDTCNVLNNCHTEASCLYIEEIHSYTCVCNEGFEGDGFNCEVEFISCTKVDNCDPHATCTYVENLGKSKCICNPGFAGDGYNCSVAAICTSNNDCTATEECVYSTHENRYECICREGFGRDSQHQCVKAVGSCGGGSCVENAECLFDENDQTYYCACKVGFVGDGITECKRESQDVIR